MTTATDARIVDQTVFVQILNAYSARNPCALISDSEYNECLEQLVNNESQEYDGHDQQRGSSVQKTCGLQERLGTKLFVKAKKEENVLVAGTKTRHLELVPFSRVYDALEELTSAHTEHRQLQQAVSRTFRSRLDRWRMPLGQGYSPRNTRGNRPGILRHGFCSWTGYR